MLGGVVWSFFTHISGRMAEPKRSAGHSLPGSGAAGRAITAETAVHSPSSWVVRYLGRVPYLDGLQQQEEIVAGKLRGDPCDYLLLLEHEPVYTIGRGGEEADLRDAPQRFSIPVFRVGRGGGVTFHGPGQLVAYPILTLTRRDLHRYVEFLHSVLVGVCRRYGLPARPGADAGHIGVWIENRKIASIGLGVRRWVAYHGVALNVDTDLEYFTGIVPCRLPGLLVTSLARELGRGPDWEDVVRVFVEEFFAKLCEEEREGNQHGAGRYTRGSPTS